jgi:hypothetical protein
MWQVGGHKSPAGHSWTSKGARDDTQRVQKCGPSQSGLENSPQDPNHPFDARFWSRVQSRPPPRPAPIPNSALRCPVLAPENNQRRPPKPEPRPNPPFDARVRSPSSIEPAPKTRTKAKLGLRRPAPVASAASTAPAPSPSATGPSFAGWGLLALPGGRIAAPDVRRSRCLLALWLAIRLTVRGLYLGRSGAAMVGVPFLGDLDCQAVLLRILRDAHLGLQRADDVLEPAIVRWQHERVGSLAVGRADYFLR